MGYMILQIHALEQLHCARQSLLCGGMVDLLVDDECVNIDSVNLTSALGSTLPDPPNTW